MCCQDRASWENEKDIYAVLKPLMDRKPYILNFITAQERVGDPEDRELWIVTDYHVKGYFLSKSIRALFFACQDR